MSSGAFRVLGREKGEGSIEQLPSGKFRAVVSEGSKATGGQPGGPALLPFGVRP